MALEHPTPQKVRELRARHGLSQAALGRLAHTTSRNVQRWETEGAGGRSMPLSTWELLLAKVGEIRISTKPATKVSRKSRAAAKPAPATASPATTESTEDRLERMRALAQSLHPPKP